MNTTSYLIGSGFVLFTAAVQAAILAILIKRNKRSEFPIFFWYNALAVASAVVLFIADTIHVSRFTYFYMWWGLNSIVMLTEFFVMYEIFVKALKPYNGLIDLGKMLFRWAAAFLLIAATLTSFATNDPTLAKCVAATSQIERSLRLMQCGLLLLFFLFERRLGLAWRSPAVSIGLGLGVSASLSLSFAYLHLRMPQWASAVDYTNYVQYLAVVGFWAVCFYIREPERKSVLEAPSKLIFQRWNDVLVSSRFAGVSSSASIGMDSFLPNVEQTVERILARKMVQ